MRMTQNLQQHVRRFLAYSSRNQTQTRSEDDAMANAYEKAGLLLKAIEITTCKKQLYRLWNEYKEKAKVEINRYAISSERYRIVISSLLKLDDVKGAEEIYEEWEPKGPEFDSRIPCLLISRYYKEGDEVKVREIVNSSRQKRKWMQFEMFKEKLVDFGITCAVVAFFGVVLICALMNPCLFIMVLIFAAGGSRK